MFEFFDPKTLYRKEKEIKDRIGLENYNKRRELEQEAWEANAEKTRKKIEKKKNLKVSKNIRFTERSRKPEV